MSTKLRQLALSCFRGATQAVKINFDPDKKIMMIFGENATGKSSIVDAFSFLCEQSFGSLEDRSGADKKHIASILGRPDDLRAVLTTTTGTWKASYTGTSIRVEPSDGLPDVKILRRSQILRFIETQPKERFEALKDYIAVPGVDRSEQSLREAVRGVNEELTRLTQAYSQAHTALENLWNAEGKPGISAEAWAKEEKGKDLTKLQQECEEIDRILQAFRDAERARSSWQNARSRFSSAETAYQKALAEEKVEEEKAVGQTGVLLSLLNKAREYIRATKDVLSCPVCQQPVQADSLANELQARITSMSGLSQATSMTETRKRSLDFALDALNKAEQEYASVLSATSTLVGSSGLPTVTAVYSGGSVTKSLTDPIVSLEDKVQLGDSFLGPFPNLQSALVEHKQKAQKSLNQQNAIALQLETVLKKESGQKAAAGLLGQLQNALAIVESERKKFVSEVLRDISQEVEHLFENLHPGEGIGKLKLSLDPRYIGSLHLYGDFHKETNIPPQSLFSDSHLDTLRLCVFLALAKRYKTEDTIVILDDVLTSVDGNHLNRFIELLHNEQSHFNQIILTTHYRPWKDRYRNHRAPGAAIHFIELRSWSLDQGVRIQGMKLSLQELRDTVSGAPFDRQAIASKAGIFLENLLEFLARIYRCRLPLTDLPNYTLGELARCFPRELLKLLKVDRLSLVKDQNDLEQLSVDQTIDLKPVIESIKGLSAVRNQVGCHHNYDGSNVTDAEIEQLANEGVKLGQALICAERGDLPSRNKSGSYWESRSGRVRLYPLQQPN